jgi:hypothetical protein
LKGIGLDERKERSKMKEMVVVGGLIREVIKEVIREVD